MLKIIHIYENSKTADRVLYSNKQIYSEDAKFFNDIGAQVAVQWVRGRVYTCAYFNDDGGDCQHMCVIGRGRQVIKDLRELVEDQLGMAEPAEPFMKYGDGITLTGKMVEQLKEMDLCAEQTINIYEVHDGPDGAGVYAYFTEHPDEGYMFLGVVK